MRIRIHCPGSEFIKFICTAVGATKELSVAHIQSSNPVQVAEHCVQCRVLGCGERKLSFLDIRCKARAIYLDRQLTFKPFRCSALWLKKFIHKFGLTTSGLIDLQTETNQVRIVKCLVNF